MSTQSNIAGRKLPTRIVCQRYHVCDRTIARWERDPELGFPAPIVINGRKFFDEEALVAFDIARATQR